MRIGVVFFDYDPEIGGGYSYETEVINSLIKHGGQSEHSFVIFSNRYVENNPHPANKNNSNIKFLKLPTVPWHERVKDRIKTRFNVARIYLKQESFLDQYLRNIGIEFLWFVSPGPILTDIPYAATVWDLQHRLQPWFPETSSNGIWDKREISYDWFLRRAAFVITGNQAGRQELEQLYQISGDRIALLPHMTPSYALSNAVANVDILNKYNINKDYLFYPAQFWPHKNHVNLLYAVRELRDKYKLDFPVVFAGSDQGNLGHVKAVTSQLGLDSRVHFLGFVPRDDLIALYQNAFALVYVSFFGPENLTPLEAFGLKCPVVAARVNGSDEQLGDAALLVNPTEPGEIALAIKRLHDDPGFRETLCNRGLKKSKAYTPDDYITGMFQLLDKFSTIRRCWGK